MTSADQLFDAIDHGDIDQVRSLLARKPALARSLDAEGATPMHHATFHGHREIVDLLLSCGADINARDGLHNATPAGWAIEYIRECGGLLGIEIEDLIYAIGRRDITWARRLTTRHPALLQAVDREGTPLSVHAARTNDPQFVALFETADQRPEKA